MSLTRVAIHLTALFLFLAGSFAFAEEETPQKLTSPDGRYSVEIVEKQQPGSEDDFTLVLSSRDKLVAQYPTYGFLIDAHWSPDGKCVAINNRRGNSGDYIWVLELPSGNALKHPDDKIGETWEKAALEAVHAKFAAASEETLRKDWLTATGWENGHIRLVVRSVYERDNHKWDFEAVADPKTGQIKSSKISKKSADAE
jgi:hypothetical protein